MKTLLITALTVLITVNANAQTPFGSAPPAAGTNVTAGTTTPTSTVTTTPTPVVVAPVVTPVTAPVAVTTPVVTPVAPVVTPVPAPTVTTTPVPVTVTVTPGVTPTYSLVFLFTIPTGETFQSLQITADGTQLFLVTNKSVYSILKNS